MGPGRCRWGYLVTIRRGETLLAPQSQTLHDGRQVPLTFLSPRSPYCQYHLCICGIGATGEFRGRPQGSPRHATPLPPLQRYEEISPAVSVLVLPLHAHLIVKVQQGGLEAFDDFFPLLIPIVVDQAELCSTTLTVARLSSTAEPPPCCRRWPFLVDLISPGSQTSDLMQE